MAVQSSGVPWGLTVTPFAAKDENDQAPAYGLDGHLLPRCENCYAYFNTYCELDQWAWNCSLCGTLNVIMNMRILSSYDSLVRSPFCYLFYFAFDLQKNFLELTKSALQAALEGPIPVKNVFVHQDTEGILPIELEDVMPLLQFLAPVETCKDRITSALETLRPITSWERTPGAGQVLDGVLMGGRARVFACLSGPPDYGPGQLDTRRYGEQYASKGEDADCALLPEQTPFYKDLAAVAVQAGVCVDIFAVTNEYTDLASLKFLSIESGGSLFLYANTDDSTLPQDMYRMLSRLYAFNCVLRLRTSTEFKPGHSYGHFFPDPQYENVQHIICCDSFATYSYDFDFANNVGFSRFVICKLLQIIQLQIAFQYTVVVPPEELSSLGLVSSSRGKHSLKRRLRIRTLQYGTAQNLNDLYDSVDPEPVLSLLVHTVILASLEQGVREGRMLLHDWLNGSSSITAQMDVTFSQCPQLQPLAHLVFALLRNPLLRFHEEGVHPGYRIYLQCLFSALEPSSLHRAIYPMLTSYSTPDKPAYPRHSLSRAALISSGSPIFFLDAFTTLSVFYSSTADPSLPFPPPHDCLLRSTINKLKQDRCITPKLVFIWGGQDDATVFENYLIEEQDVDGSGLTSVMGFVSFLEDIPQSVLEYMK
ncbi:hypothetical protein ES332_D05G089100v1 [Gossypium tomentosum]|uniref:Sec23/Sec24 trunk domain-containing protein n=1 Tax=Gossypium tomentosum TaxID=34277 RepID=A0A5D2KT57_GOSTO|nr:hypothetical protein ES332_D05G089100v1 [Gossypium tomentosum]